MRIDKSSSERILTMHAVRMLSQTAEALSFSIWNAHPDTDVRHIAQHAEGCANRAKQCAVNDLEMGAEKDRMWHLVKDVEWLTEVVELDKTDLARNKLHYPSIDDLENLLDLLKAKAGMGR